MLMLGWVLGLGLGPQQDGLRPPDELTTFVRLAPRECGTLAFLTGKPTRFQSRRPTCSKSSRNLLPESFCGAGFALGSLGQVTRAARGVNNDQRKRRRNCRYSTAQNSVLSDSHENYQDTMMEATAVTDEEGATLKSADAATGGLLSLLQTRLKISAKEALSMMSSRPALLAVTAQDMDTRVTALKALLDGTESDISAILTKQPHFLLVDVNDSLKEKVKWLANAGLVPAEVRTLVATYTAFIGLDLDAMQEGVGLLRTELDLSPREVAKVVVEKPSILSSSKDTLQRQLRFYFDVLRLTKEDTALMVVKNPTILRLSVENLRVKMRYFMEDLGLRRLQLTELMLKQPHVVGVSVEKKLRINVEYLEHGIGIPRTHLRRVIMSLPSLLSYSVEKVLKPKVRWLSANCHLEEDQLRKIIIRHPQVLSLSVKNNLEPKLLWLRDTFGVSDHDLSGMIVKNPSILFYNTETGIKRKVRHLTEHVGLEEARLLKILIRSPILLSYSTESVGDKVSYFKESWKLDREQVVSLITRCPQVLGYAVTSMESKLTFLIQALDSSREEAIGIILKYPQVLNLDVEKNLRAKIDFFTRDLQGSPEIVRGTIGGTPSVLGYSLRKRIIPRVAVMRSLGVEPTFVDHIWVVSSYTELRFTKWLEKGVINDVGAFRRGDTEVRRRMKVYRGMLRSPAA